MWSFELEILFWTQRNVVILLEFGSSLKTLKTTAKTVSQEAKFQCKSGRH
jgi:hypothetical protein